MAVWSSSSSSSASHHKLSHMLSQSHETGMSWYWVGPDSFCGGTRRTRGQTWIHSKTQETLFYFG